MAASYIPFVVHWDAPLELYQSFGENITEWGTLIIKVRHDNTIEHIMGRIKDKIVERIKVQDNFVMGGLPGVMHGLTRAKLRQLALEDNTANEEEDHDIQDESLELSDQEQRICWFIRFRTAVGNANTEKNLKRFIDLNTGAGRRLTALSDIFIDPATKTPGEGRFFHVAIELDSFVRSTPVTTTNDLSDFVFPRREDVRYVQVGTVQSENAHRLELEPTASTIPHPHPTPGQQTIPEPIGRKNAIVARFPESRKYVLDDPYRFVPCWEFKRQSGLPVFRIGDPEESQRELLTTIRVQGNTKLYNDLEPMTAKKYLDTIYAESLAPTLDNRAPTLPPMTFNKYDPKSNGNNDASVTTNLHCTAAINVFNTNHRPDPNKNYPKRSYVPLAKYDTVQNIENKLFALSQPNATLTNAVVKTWWIMPESRGLAKMYKIAKTAMPFQYVRKARIRTGEAQIYMECHMGPIIQEDLFDKSKKDPTPSSNDSSTSTKTPVIASASSTASPSGSTTNATPSNNVTDTAAASASLPDSKSLRAAQTAITQREEQENEELAGGLQAMNMQDMMTVDDMGPDDEDDFEG